MKWNEVTWYSKLAAVIFFLGIFPVLTFYIGTQYQEVKDLNAGIIENQVVAPADYKSATYTIEGTRVTLADGSAEAPITPGSATMVRTQYFGNELKTDLNGDGREDVAFILTQNQGGSGTFYYAVAALNMANGYIGSDAYVLGDRIAPQSVTLSPDPSQQYVVVFNYADRAAGEPMTTQPSVGKSAYLKLDPDTMQWAIVLSPEAQQSL